jgi:hypothetical protein
MAKYLRGIAMIAGCVITTLENPGFYKDLRVDDFREHMLDA